jgi:hypothetical protein
MGGLIVESYLLLIHIDLLMRFRDLRSIHALIRKRKAVLRPMREESSVQELCQAIDLACVFYFKRVLCLQRSAATTLLLSRYSHHAEMVIGAQILPFKSHAWVEVNGAIVNDKPYMLDIYQVLERC